MCIAPAFRQVVRLGAPWPVLFTFLCMYTPQLLTASAFLCPSLLSLRAHMDELQNMRLPFGSQGGITLTTRAIRSQHYILSNSYKLVRAPRPLCRCRPPHECHMVQRPQVLCPAHRLHTVPSVHRFRRAPTRTVTSDLMSATLAEAATQLSFVAFLECCISVSAPPPPQLPIATPLLDAATQTIPHIAVSQDVSTQLSLEKFSLKCVHSA